ncbi:hypothetical protein LSTR_LSTR016434 [Laodelphax striatellus]|uniref:Uncharacterized protein n=1 Tax=Laodelphax striatellus TaxID=195883 RepID=A0A482WTW0_LAOST|nr:hypothetical protein LSTR_LSTR016434 [Laodelphax striatellus]
MVKSDIRLCRPSQIDSAGQLTGSPPILSTSAMSLSYNAPNGLKISGSYTVRAVNPSWARAISTSNLSVIVTQQCHLVTLGIPEQQTLTSTKSNSMEAHQTTMQQVTRPYA